MSTSAYTILIGVVVIILAGVIFRKRLATVPIGYALSFIFGMMAALGSEYGVKKRRQVKDRYGL